MIRVELSVSVEMLRVNYGRRRENPDLVRFLIGTGVTNLRIEMVFVVNNDWKQKYIQTTFMMRCCRNRVQPSGIAVSLNLNIVGLIVPSQLVYF